MFQVAIFMKRVPVSSTCAKSVGYDPKHRILAIEYTNGGLTITSRYARAFTAELSNSWFAHCFVGQWAYGD